MINPGIIRPLNRLSGIVLLTVALSFLAQPLLAQHGHPLVGTWSGFLNREDGDPLRALFQFTFSADQVISGALMVNGRRYPITDASLNPDDWSVSVNAQGEDREGNPVNYMMTATIENLDSPTQRTLLGTWHEGGDRGEFRVVIN